MRSSDGALSTTRISIGDRRGEASGETLNRESEPSSLCTPSGRFLVQMAIVSEGTVFLARLPVSSSRSASRRIRDAASAAARSATSPAFTTQFPFRFCIQNAIGTPLRRRVIAAPLSVEHSGRSVNGRVTSISKSG